LRGGFWRGVRKRQQKAARTREAIPETRNA
jgi:hypothetical protein